MIWVVIFMNRSHLKATLTGTEKNSTVKLSVTQPSRHLKISHSSRRGKSSA
jgi:hypothetical protein